MQQPKFNIGDKVYRASTKCGQETVQCPDCLGSGLWSVKAPSGYEGETKCPRCSGRKALRKQFQSEAEVTPLTIGSVRMDTNDKNSMFSYMCEETGVGSGSVYRESQLFSSHEEATEEAEALARQRTAEGHERNPDPNRELGLYDLPYRDALIKEKEHERHEVSFNYLQLIDRICSLNNHPTAGGEFTDDGWNYPSLTDEQVLAVQNSLVWLDKRATEELLTRRAEDSD